MGWVVLVVLALVAMIGLSVLGVRRPLWSLAGAALMLGAAGYAWQGRATLPAHDPVLAARADLDDPALLDLRNRMLGTFSGDYPYLVAADAMGRAGDQRAAVRVILGGIGHIPQSVMLWTALGNALSAHDGGQLSPPALFAYQQAIRLSPNHPAPLFFLGLAQIRGSDFQAARRSWAKALALTPKRASYRPDIALRLALLDRYLVLQAIGQPAPR